MPCANLETPPDRCGDQLWLGRFSVSLMRLRGDITLRAAVGRAVQAHLHSSALAPELAALIDAAQRRELMG